jgi:hypothetical protein
MTANQDKIAALIGGNQRPVDQARAAIDAAGYSTAVGRHSITVDGGLVGVDYRPESSGPVPLVSAAWVVGGDSSGRLRSTSASDGQRSVAYPLRLGKSDIHSLSANMSVQRCRTET